MNLIKPLIVIAFLFGIPAYFIGVLTGAVWLVQHLSIPEFLVYPVAAIVIGLSIWLAVSTSERAFKRLGL